MPRELPHTLEYLGAEPELRPRPNVPASISLGCGLAGAVFLLTALLGIWKFIYPPLAQNAGWITGMLATLAIVNGAVGALQSERDSGWYRAALFGYGIGLFVGCLTPIFFIA